MSDVGKRIRARRIELGISQEELAAALGYKSRSSINKIELGIQDVRQRKIVEFAKCLKCTPGFLAGYIEPQEEKIEECDDNSGAFKVDSRERRLLEVFRSLSPEQQSDLMKYLAFLQSQKQGYYTDDGEGGAASSVS